MKRFIQLCFVIILTACNSSDSQTRSYTKSKFVGQIESEKIADYFSPFHVTTFGDSIKIRFNVKKQPDYDNLIELRFITAKDTIKTNLNRKGSLLHSNDNIFIDINKNIAFVSWISEPYYNPQLTDERHAYELYLKSIDLTTGIELFNQKIFTTKCCIERLSMKFNPSSSSVLFSYNDFSRPDSRYLMLGFVKITSDKKNENSFDPKEIISEDKSEKRFPKFLQDKQNIYLYHSNGDSWGFFEHTGKQQIGLSRIDEANNPTDYRVIRDSLSIDDKLFLKSDTVYYRVRVEKKNQPDEMRIKRTTLKDLTK